MARYINADNFRAWILKQKRLSKDYTVMMLDDTPTADVQEVIRCENCRYSVPLDRNCELSQCYLHCTEWHGEETKNVWHKYKKYYKNYSIVERDDFCSFGARMDGDSND